MRSWRDPVFLVVLLLVICSTTTGRLISESSLSVQHLSTAAVLAFEQTLAEVHVTNNGVNLTKCRLHEVESAEEEKTVLESLKLPRVNVSLPEMLRVIEECKAFGVNGSRPEDSNNLTDSEESSRRVDNGTKPWAVTPGILPGTMWCGMGDIANSYEDLGPRRELDRCCRAHDHCPIKLKAFRSGWGLINFSLYTKSHCECDRNFYDCLKTTNTNLSNVLGNFYFNMMKVQCMKPQRPMVCAEKIVSLEGKSQCIRWKYVPNAPKMSFINPERRY